jgi:hypothetical protein
MNDQGYDQVTDVATEDYWLRFSLIGFRGELPLLNFNRQAPLCMVCGDEFNHPLQEAVNQMWGLAKPLDTGKMVSTPHAALE